MRLPVIVLITIIASCTVDKKLGVSEIAGENYTIQVMPLPMHGDDDGRTSGYKVRILPTQKISDEYGKQLQEKLWYQTDSCFYITERSTPIKPALVQPVATGVVNCYEFMLVFEGLSASANDERTLVFNDPNITREKYAIKLIRRQ